MNTRTSRDVRVTRLKSPNNKNRDKVGYKGKWVSNRVAGYGAHRQQFTKKTEGRTAGRKNTIRSQTPLATLEMGGTDDVLCGHRVILFLSSFGVASGTANNCSPMWFTPTLHHLDSHQT